MLLLQTAISTQLPVLPDELLELEDDELELLDELEDDELLELEDELLELEDEEPLQLCVLAVQTPAYWPGWLLLHQ